MFLVFHIISCTVPLPHCFLLDSPPFFAPVFLSCFVSSPTSLLIPQEAHHAAPLSLSSCFLSTSLYPSLFIPHFRSFFVFLSLFTFTVQLFSCYVNFPDPSMSSLYIFTFSSSTFPLSFCLSSHCFHHSFIFPVSIFSAIIISLTFLPFRPRFSHYFL